MTFVSLFFASRGVAQETIPGLEAGQPVRITSVLLNEPTVVTFEGLRADTLFAVYPLGDPLRLPLSQIDRIERARVDRLRGALVGIPVGVLAVTTALTVYATSQGGWMEGGGLGDHFGFSLIFGVPIGGTLGAIAGGIVGAKRWERIEMLPYMDEP